MNSNTFNLGGEMPVNRMGYGAMRITGKGVWGMPEDKKEAIAVLQQAVELGVNFIDTADSYGPNVSEELIAEALYPYKKGLVIATKGGFTRSGPNAWHINCHPGHLRQALEGSLSRLKQGCVDLYQLHRIDPNVPFEDTLAFLQRAQEDGLIRHIGLSEVGVKDLETAARYVKITALQNKYSLVYRNWEKELEYCTANNIAFIPWNPINANNILAVETLNRIAATHSVKPQQVALNWLYNHAPNILLIPGTSKTKHLAENMESVNINLTAEEVKELDNVAG